jgi:hypothetical protein
VLGLVFESVRMFTFYWTTETTDRIPQNGLAFDADFEHLARKGKSIKCYHWQGRTTAKKLHNAPSQALHEGRGGMLNKISV